MSFVDLLFLKNRENVVQIVEYKISSERFLTQILASEERLEQHIVIKVSSMVLQK